MKTQDLLQRIARDSHVVAGRPRVQGTRLTVRYVVSLMASGASVEDVLAEHPNLAREDVRACLAYAAEMLEQMPAIATVETV